MTSAAAAQTTSTIVPTPDSGQAEIRDNTGRVTGYIIENDAIGGFDVKNAAARSKGFLLPDEAIGGLAGAWAAHLRLRTAAARPAWRRR